MITGIYDDEAEEVVAGCAVATPAGADMATVHVQPEDFRNPVCRDLVLAADTCPDLTDTDERIEWCAERAGQYAAAVEALVVRRPVMWDTAGTYAARVRTAAARRREAHDLIDQLEALGLDVTTVGAPS